MARDAATVVALRGGARGPDAGWWVPWWHEGGLRVDLDVGAGEPGPG